MKTASSGGIRAWSVGVAIVSLVLLSSGLFVAAGAEGSEQCSGEVVLTISGARLLNRDGSRTAGPFPIELAAGTWTVTAGSFDGYHGPDQLTQAEEQWYVVADSGWVSPFTNDIPDDLQRSQTRWDDQVISAPVQSIMVVHRGVGGINSVEPSCLGFTLVEPSPAAPAPAESGGADDATAETGGDTDAESSAESDEGAGPGADVGEAVSDPAESGDGTSDDGVTTGGQSPGDATDVDGAVEVVGDDGDGPDSGVGDAEQADGTAATAPEDGNNTRPDATDAGADDPTGDPVEEVAAPAGSDAGDDAIDAEDSSSAGESTAQVTSDTSNGSAAAAESSTDADDGSAGAIVPEVAGVQEVNPALARTGPGDLTDRALGLALVLLGVGGVASLFSRRHEYDL